MAFSQDPLGQRNKEGMKLKKNWYIFRHEMRGYFLKRWHKVTVHYDEREESNAP